MREVFRGGDFTQVGYCKSILDEAGIINFIQNGNNPQHAGGLFASVLCVRDDRDFDEAVRLLKERLKPNPTNALDWRCASCSEENPANFELCWNCQTPRPAI